VPNLRRLATTLLGAVALTALTACGGASSPGTSGPGAAQTHLLSSVGDFHPYEFLDDGTCSVGMLRSGMQVVVRDEKGEVLGSDFVASEPFAKKAMTSVYRCRFTWSVSVPDRPFYEVELAGQKIVHSRGDLEAVGWTLVVVSTDVPFD
jgi:hypothetical protein